MLCVICVYLQVYLYNIIITACYLDRFLLIPFILHIAFHLFQILDGLPSQIVYNLNILSNLTIETCTNVNKIRIQISDIQHNVYIPIGIRIHLYIHRYIYTIKYIIQLVLALFMCTNILLIKLSYSRARAYMQIVCIPVVH